jgi:hypothetical protein
MGWDGEGHLPCPWRLDDYAAAVGTLSIAQRERYLRMGCRRHNPWVPMTEWLRERGRVSPGPRAPDLMINNQNVAHAPTLFEQMLAKRPALICINDDWSEEPRQRTLQVALSTRRWIGCSVPLARGRAGRAIPCPADSGAAARIRGRRARRRRSARLPAGFPAGEGASGVRRRAAPGGERHAAVGAAGGVDAVAGVADRGGNGFRVVRDACCSSCPPQSISTLTFAGCRRAAVRGARAVTARAGHR